MYTSIHTWSNNATKTHNINTYIGYKYASHLLAIQCIMRATRSCTKLHPITLHDIHTYIHTYIHKYIHTCMHACMHTCAHADIHTFAHAYMHPNMHTYINISRHITSHHFTSRLIGLQQYMRTCITSATLQRLLTLHKIRHATQHHITLHHMSPHGYIFNSVALHNVHA